PPREAPRTATARRELRAQPGRRRFRIDRWPADPPFLPADRAGTLRRSVPEGARTDLAVLPRSRLPPEPRGGRGARGRDPRDRGRRREALTVRYHGVLVDVGGVGVLLAGPSGAGKSECALELIARGHRLVADDAVELSRDGECVIGRAAPAIGPHLEIRGLGIL